MVSREEIEEAVRKEAEKFTLKMEEEKLLRITEWFLKTNVPTVARNEQKLKAFFRLGRPELQREYFGRELNAEEREILERCTNLWQEATIATKKDVGLYYGLNRALKEYGWDKHFSERTKLLSRVDEWLREKRAKGEL